MSRFEPRTPRKLPSSPVTGVQTWSIQRISPVCVADVELEWTASLSASRRCVGVLLARRARSSSTTSSSRSEGRA